MSELITLELKYCERCGGLLLRRTGLNLNFCKPCQHIERDLPLLRPRKPRSYARAAVVPFPSTSLRVPELHACCPGDPA